MEYTVGIFLITPTNKILICHPTNAPQTSWSVPKGLKDYGEHAFDTGMRELKEETNISHLYLEKMIHQVKRMSEVKYPNRSKTLIPYFITLNDEFPKNYDLYCSSMVKVDGEYSFPEVDDFEWVDLDKAMNLLHITQVHAIKEFLDNQY